MAQTSLHCFLANIIQHRVTDLLSDSEVGMHTTDGLIIGQQNFTILTADHILLTREQNDTFPFRKRKEWSEAIQTIITGKMGTFSCYMTKSLSVNNNFSLKKKKSHFYNHYLLLKGLKVLLNYSCPLTVLHCQCFYMSERCLRQSFVKIKHVIIHIQLPYLVHIILQGLVIDVLLRLLCLK